MNSPYTKHLDATLDKPTSGGATTAVAAPVTTTHSMTPAVPATAPQPTVIQTTSDESSGGKVVWILIALIVGAVAAFAGWAYASYSGPTWNELKRFEALAGREGEIRGRDQGWAQGRSQGRTEMNYLAKYERLRNQASSFNAGWKQGLGIGREMGSAQAAARYGYGRYGRAGYGGYGGYGGYYGRTNNAIAQAQNLANMTGQPVDVVID